MTLIAPAVQAFFTTRLITQQAASPETISSYRDAIRLLAEFASARSGKPPSRLDFADVDHRCVAEFLDHLAAKRGNTDATRNNRLAAVRSMFAASVLAHPEHANDIAMVLAIPARKTTKSEVVFLRDDEADALTAAPDTQTRAGRRDQAIWATALGTGMRISELTSLTRASLDNAGKTLLATVVGKGRKQRTLPLPAATAQLLNQWLKETPGAPATPVFPNRIGGRMSRDAVEARLKQSVLTASEQCESIRAKHVTCHILRHTFAMKLIRAGIDVATIALWLGHESIETTKIYLHADLALKQQALDRIPQTAAVPVAPYKPDDDLLAYLQGL
ncbi:MAG: site-specific integrase [Bifidobacteriaceae bacterium]|jgi:site-specific recombinase XerD|nr:site-specific integrase [Bifidobacteriaceae bacterium]